MNEHIKEMARQCGGIDMTNHAAGGITTWIGTGTSEFIQQFAESIIKECLKVGEDYSEDFYHFKDEILKHFKVENE